MKAGANRWAMVFVLVLAGLAHAATSDATPNTPFGMAVFHGVAALVDILILLTVSNVLDGSVRRHTQSLLCASAAGNLFGYVLYMLYVSPAYYDGFMWALTALQIARLLYVAKGDEGIGGAAPAAA